MNTVKPHIAQILPLLDTAHLDRFFDYRIPDDMQVLLRVGMKVRIRFHGRLVDGIVYHITDTTDFSGNLGTIDRIVSPYLILNDQLRNLTEKIAQRYVGTRPEVIRLILPHRIARAEKTFLHNSIQDSIHNLPQNSISSTAELSEGSQSSSVADRLAIDRTKATASVAALIENATQQTSSYRAKDAQQYDTQTGLAATRIVWQLPPYTHWMERIAELITCYAAQNLSLIILVPTAIKVKQLYTFLIEHMQSYRDRIVQLTDDCGPEKHYRTWLNIAYGCANIVIGARHAVYAPVAQLSAIIIFDDGDNNYCEPLAPYPHTRTVAMMRSAYEQCDIFFLGYSRSVETQALVESGWATSIAHTDRSALPKTRAVASSMLADPLQARLRIPHQAYTLIFAALEKQQPVIIHVYRRGYSHVLYCFSCNELARCRKCHGPLTAKDDTTLSCLWCNDIISHFRCLGCGKTRIASALPGVKRTAQELGKAFSPYPIIMSAKDSLHTDITPGAKVVICTSGAEPYVPGGYAVGVVLDLTSSLLRPDLRVYEDTYRQIMNFVSYLSLQGQLFVAADVEMPIVQAIINYQPIDFACAELQSRITAALPPAVRLAAIDGQCTSIDEFMGYVQLPETAEILGPVPLSSAAVQLNERVFGAAENAHRMIIRIPVMAGPQLSAALSHARRQFSLHKKNTAVRIAIDPQRIG